MSWLTVHIGNGFKSGALFRLLHAHKYTANQLQLAIPSASSLPISLQWTWWWIRLFSHCRRWSQHIMFSYSEKGDTESRKKIERWKRGNAGKCKRESLHSYEREPSNSSGDIVRSDQWSRERVGSQYAHRALLSIGLIVCIATFICVERIVEQNVRVSVNWQLWNIHMSPHEHLPPTHLRPTERDRLIHYIRIKYWISTLISR